MAHHDNPPRPPFPRPKRPSSLFGRKRRWRQSLVALVTALTLHSAVQAQTVSASNSPSPVYLFSSEMPPGAIGRQLLASGQLREGRVQPVELIAPAGMTIATAHGSVFAEEQQAPIMVGMLVGNAYRLKISGFPLEERIELYPTVEIIDELHPPQGREFEFPIPVEFTIEDLRLAAAGNLVTRVVYIEDPENALPVPNQDDHGQRYYEVRAGEDPLHVADTLGRAVAIVRLGSRAPLTNIPTAEFLLFSPPIQRYREAVPFSQRAPAPVEQFEVGDNRRVNRRNSRLPPPMPIRPVSWPSPTRARR